MRKLLFWVLFWGIAFVGFEANAGVRFITDVPNNSIVDRPSSGLSVSKSRCVSAGYSKTAASCGYTKVPVNPCPYNGSYYKDCCAAKYRYTKEYCIHRGMQPSSSSCGGRYACE